LTAHIYTQISAVPGYAGREHPVICQSWQISPGRFHLLQPGVWRNGERQALFT